MAFFLCVTEARGWGRAVGGQGGGLGGSDEAMTIQSKGARVPSDLSVVCAIAPLATTGVRDVRLPRAWRAMRELPDARADGFCSVARDEARALPRGGPTRGYLF